MVRARPAVEHLDRGPVANPPLEELQPANRENALPRRHSSTASASATFRSSAVSSGVKGSSVSLSTSI